MAIQVLHQHPARISLGGFPCHVFARLTCSLRLILPAGATHCLCQWQVRQATNPGPGTRRLFGLEGLPACVSAQCAALPGSLAVNLDWLQGLAEARASQCSEDWRHRHNLAGSCKSPKCVSRHFRTGGSQRRHCALQG